MCSNIYFVLGDMYYIDEDGESNKVYSSNSSILKILCHESKDVCVIFCNDHTLSYQICHKDGSLSEVSKVIIFFSFVIT